LNVWRAIGLEMADLEGKCAKIWAKMVKSVKSTLIFWRNSLYVK
jgi:hypothetical protein